MRIKLFMLLVLYFFYNSSYAAGVNVAVAANFSGPMQKIASTFEQTTGHKTGIAFSTVGKFYALCGANRYVPPHCRTLARRGELSNVMHIIFRATAAISLVLRLAAIRHLEGCLRSISGWQAGS
jgi:hypothetical protein